MTFCSLRAEIKPRSGGARRDGGACPFEEGNGEIDELIGVADDEQSSQGKVDDANDFNWLHDDVPL